MSFPKLPSGGSHGERTSLAAEPRLPRPELQRLALQLFQAQLAGRFSLQAVWQPRELNVRADYLSRVAAMLHHAYRLRKALFRWLDDRWGAHTIDHFVSVETYQPLAPPFMGRFCSQYRDYHPAAVWTDAFSVPWHGEVNWLFPPVPAIAQTIAHLRSSRAVGTLIVPFAAWSPWLLALRRGRAWDPLVRDVVRLGAPRYCLCIPVDQRCDFCGCVLIALRLDVRSIVSSIARRCSSAGRTSPRRHKVVKELTQAFLTVLKWHFLGSSDLPVELLDSFCKSNAANTGDAYVAAARPWFAHAVAQGFPAIPADTPAHLLARHGWLSEQRLQAHQESELRH